jgi:hypothetical protein
VLQNTGFSRWGSQAVLVKHTVQHTQKEMPKVAANLEGIPVSAPYSQYLLTNFTKEQGMFSTDAHNNEPADRKILTLITK